ncbi:MAG: hypothetical protein IKW98_06110 [Prevotella sp.]|nr:hypothetical protein [Prevotella sp.]
MRKTIMMALGCLLFALTASAQDRVAEIRKMYSEAKKNIEVAERKEKQGKPSDMTRAVSNYTLPNGTVGKVTTTYYFKTKENKDVERYFFHPYFIVNTYDVGFKYYQEFLFDDDEQLAFYYEKNSGDETRFYFSANEDDEEGIVHEINSSSRTIQPPFAHRIAMELLSAFNLLMNREF